MKIMISTILSSIEVKDSDKAKIQAVATYIQTLEASARYMSSILEKSQTFKWMKLPGTNGRNLIVEAAKFPKAAND